MGCQSQHKQLKIKTAHLFATQGHNTRCKKKSCLENFPFNTQVKAPKRHYHKEPSKNQVGCVFTKSKTLRRESQNVRQGGSLRRLPLSILNKLMDWSRNAASGSSVSGGCRAGSLFARLPTWLLFWLTSSCAWDPASAPATKHTSSGTPHASAFLLLLLL